MKPFSEILDLDIYEGETMTETKEFKIEIITGHHGEKVELPIDGIVLGATVDTYSNREHYLVRIVLLVPVEEVKP